MSWIETNTDESEVRVDQEEFLENVLKWLEENERSSIEPLLASFQMMID